MYIDANYDGCFSKNESHKLVRYFDGPGLDNQQRQLMIMLYPTKVAIAKVNQVIDLTILEPEPDQTVLVELKQNRERDNSLN